MTTEEKAHEVDPFKPLGRYTQEDLRFLYDGLKERVASDDATVDEVLTFKNVCEYLQLMESARNSRYPFVIYED